MNPRKLIPIAALVLAAGCMQTDPGPGKTEQSLPEDNGRRAGATSSTNWPTDLGKPLQVTIFAKPGPKLVLSFGKVNEDPELPAFLPVRLAGTVIAYRATGVPVFKDLDTAMTSFPESDSAFLAPDLITKLLLPGEDTIYLNLNVLSDSRSAWINDIGYDKVSKTFFETEYSIQTRSKRAFYQGLDTIRGILDTQIPLPKPKLSGKSVLSFYIPGSPYFKSAQVDTLQLGPIPDNVYVLRLMRVTYAGAGETGTEIESFEVQSSRIASDIIEYVFKPGALVFSYQTQTTLTQRPYWQH